LEEKHHQTEQNQLQMNGAGIKQLPLSSVKRSQSSGTSGMPKKSEHRSQFTAASGKRLVPRCRTNKPTKSHGGGGVTDSQRAPQL
jgi:hypothetical protein